jgi:catechol 2,3-dioxygenase-like lactoylglutathione lyase family enzyme
VTVKTHLNLTTKDIPASVEFYSTLLDAKPTKMLADYALFITEQPELELALELSGSVARAGDAHYGIFMDTVEEVEGAIARLTHAGLAGSIEREETCCYANQTKVWTTDPEGRRWEIYTVHSETQTRADADATCCGVGAPAAETACC